MDLMANEDAKNFQDNLTSGQSDILRGADDMIAAAFYNLAGMTRRRR